MSFNPKYLKPLGDNTTSSVVPVVWIYYNADGDNVTTAGYIPNGYNVKAKDKIIVIPANGAGHTWHTAAVSNNVITLTAES